MRSTVVALFLVAACGSGGGGGGDDTADDDPGPDATPAEPLDLVPGEWTYYEIEGTRCIDGTPSGFSVHYNPDATGLYIYLEGGGACFNSYCESLFTWSGNTPSASGVFDRNNPDNPVADWTHVYVPYCSGDVYAGDGEAELAGELRQFRGYSNFGAFLARMTASFEVDQVVLSGASAGGFGASVNYAQTQDAFGDTPVVLLDDSAPPLSSEVFPPCLQALFRDTWGLDGTLLASCGDDCDDPDDYIADYLSHLRDRFPGTRGGFFSSLEDNTIRLFAGYGWSDGWNSCSEIPSPVTGAVYTDGLEEFRDVLLDGGDGFGTFYVPGNGHTILRSGGFFSTTIGDVSPADWMRGIIDGESSHVGPE
jgi:hypothetical protein